MIETAKEVNRGVGDDEDVDIGDEIPVHNFPPLVIDKDDDKTQGGGDDDDRESSRSRSSSSSSSDTSSSSGIYTYIVYLGLICHWICSVVSFFVTTLWNNWAEIVVL